METPKFYGVNKSGKFVPRDEREIENIYAHMSRFGEGQELEITIKKKFKKRTSGQHGEETNFNGYWWGVVVRMIADAMGELDQDEVHAWVQIMGGNFKVMRDGTKVPKGTSEMSGIELKQLCERVQSWASIPGNVCEKGLYIPDPHEPDWQV